MTGLIRYAQRPVLTEWPAHCGDCGMPFKLGWFRKGDRRPRCHECYEKLGDGEQETATVEKLRRDLVAAERASSVACERLGGALADEYVTGDALMLPELKSWCVDRGLHAAAGTIDNLMEIEARRLNAARDYANAAAKAERVLTA